MNDLLKLALEAHGGLDNWNRYDKAHAHMLIDGILISAKAQAGVITDSQLELELHEQRGRYIDFGNQEGLEAHFDPERTTLVNKGKLMEVLIDPRASFKDHVFETPWTQLQLVYFSFYAVWAYLTLPFHCILPGFQTKEIDPWHEAGETWRRLHVTYPEKLACHTREQIYFFDEKGLLKRLDYEVDVNEKVTAAHYVFDYKTFQGINLPTRQLVYPRDEQGHYIKEPLVLRNDLVAIKFS